MAAAVVILSLSAGYFTLAWSEPSGAMPVTVDAPLNTGGVEQTKTGNLRVRGGDLKIDGGELKTWGETIIHSDYDGIGSDGAIRFIKGPSGSELFRIQDGGNIGIGTASPTDLLSLSTGGTASINMRSGSYTYLGTDYSAWTTVLGQNVRARRGQNPNMELGSGYKGSGASALRLNWDKIEFHAASAADIATLSEGSPFSFPKMTIQADGKIVINNGGQLCIGTTCASSTTWNTIVNNASGGGGGGGQTFTAVPIVLFSDGFEDGTLAPFTTTADTGYMDPWAIASDQKNSGTYSAKAGKVLVAFSDRYSYLSMPAVTVGPNGGRLKFSAKYSQVRWYSGLEVLDNGVKIYDLWNAGGCPSGIAADGSGNCVWNEVSLPLTSGTHNFVWRLHSYAGYSSNLWIDDVEVTEYQPAVTISGNISLNGNLIHAGSSAADCYDISGNAFTCASGYVLKGIKSSNGGAYGTPVVSGGVCCRP